jgi:hypothetical protein
MTLDLCKVMLEQVGLEGAGKRTLLSKLRHLHVEHVEGAPFNLRAKQLRQCPSDASRTGVAYGCKLMWSA